MSARCDARHCAAREHDAVAPQMVLCALLPAEPMLLRMLRLSAPVLALALLSTACAEDPADGGDTSPNQPNQPTKPGTPSGPGTPMVPGCLLDAPQGPSGSYSGAALDEIYPNIDAPLSEKEQRLYDFLMQERRAKGLETIPLSPALTTVARAHAMDATANLDTAAGSVCNLHSWSAQGPWDACCYTADHAQAQCMWSKPKELTRYASNGYEISAWGRIDAKGAVELWMGSSGHRDVLLNANSWQDQTWEAIGVGIDGDFFHVWFGTCPDYTGVVD